MPAFYNLMWCLLAVVCLFPRAFGDANKVVFQFPEYDYKETSKNELAFREFESACDQSARCLAFEGIEKTRCVRECVSPSCYKEIYKFDEGEFPETFPKEFPKKFTAKFVEKTKEELLETFPEEFLEKFLEEMLEKFSEGFLKKTTEDFLKEDFLEKI
ncbi:hypothetical protein RP20_CCG023327 [Aedes albopictus]|nr:hypothetical protein RP20_CCG023327 [Aedes albopictus]